MFGLQFEKRFGLPEAEIVHEEVTSPDNQNGDPVSVRTIKAMLKVMKIRNTVKEDIAKKTAAMTQEVTELNTANTQITADEEKAEKDLEEQIRLWKEARAKAAEEAKEQVAANTANIQDRIEGVAETNALSIYG